jgi:hypothetical protein
LVLLLLSSISADIRLFTAQVGGSMEGNRRLEVLERQLCAAQLAEAPELIEAAALSAICPKQLQTVLVHGGCGLLLERPLFICMLVL